MSAAEFRVIAGPAYWAARAVLKARQISSEKSSERLTAYWEDWRKSRERESA